MADALVLLISNRTPMSRLFRLSFDRLNIFRFQLRTIAVGAAQTRLHDVLSRGRLRGGGENYECQQIFHGYPAGLRTGDIIRPEKHWVRKYAGRDGNRRMTTLE